MMHTIPAKKSLGQHFLNNARIPEKMVDASCITQEDTVLEIGPGTGILTRELLLRAGKVIAIETDHRALALLQELFSEEIRSGKLSLLDADIRSVDLLALGLLPGEYTVVANIPYYLSGMLFRMFLEHQCQPKTLVFLAQREVVERIVRDKKESLLSLSVKVYGDPYYIRTVGRGNFTPQPQVDSAIIAIKDISKTRLHGCPEALFFTVIHAGFKSKRKQLFGNLSSLVPKDVLERIFITMDLPLKVRAEDVHLEAWLTLVSLIQIQMSSTSPQG